MKNKVTIFFFLVFTVSLSIAQSRKIDSLRSVLKIQKDDTNKVKTLISLGEALEIIDKNDSSLICANEALVLAEKLNYKKGSADANMNVGMVYYDQGNYPKALKNYLNAQTILEELGDKGAIANGYNNLGNIYDDEGNLAKAVEYYNKSLALNIESGNKNGIANNYGNLGNIYQTQKDYAKSLEALEKSLALHQEVGNKKGMTNNLGNIGNVYKLQGDYSKAIEYYFRALSLAKENGYQRNIEVNLGNMGELYIKQKNYKLASTYLDSSLTIAKKIREKENLMEIYYDRFLLDSAMDNNKRSVDDYKTYIAYRDSLINEANTKTEMKLEFEQRQAVAKAEQDRKDAIAEQDRKKQAIIRNSFIGGFILTLALVFFILRGYRQKQRANLQLAEKNKTIELQKREVDKAYSQLHEKHKEITDSINYAKRIQLALLKDEEYVSQHVPEHFILFRPKDVVSGDFYWSFEKDGYWYVAAVDCTGHGVPGAFLTMLGSAFLNEICSVGAILSPAEILNQLREKVIRELGGQGEVKDGMDISLIAISRQSRVLGTNSFKIQWAGANNPLCYVHNSQLMEVVPDKQPIGYQDGQKPFSNHSLELSKGDTVFLFTDGYADQFGGPKGKKFKYKQMQQLIMDNAQLPMQEQKQIFEQSFENWKGNLEQVDDVLIIGIRV